MILIIIFIYFQLCCAWKPEHDDEVIKNFHHLASSRLSGMLYEARQEYETRDGDFKPEWIGEEVWPQLIEYWQKDETFARRSSANKKNRDSKKGGYKHTQGSASVDTHRRALVKLYLICIFFEMCIYLITHKLSIIIFIFYVKIRKDNWEENPL
jgi:hypothetical protein